MVTAEQCMKIILKKFPEFNKAWQEHLDWWDGDIPGLSNDISAFSDYVMELIKKKGHEEELKNIFNLAEQLLHDGDSDVQNAVATCFLENLINATSGGTISARSFVHLLGEESKKYCKAWDEFTKVKTEGLWHDSIQ